MRLVNYSDNAHYADLKDKVVFITGGCSGIGAALVRGFVTQQAKVAFISNDEAAGEALMTQLENEIGDKEQYLPMFLYCDVCDTDRLQACVEQVSTFMNGIDILINNAARDDRHTLDDLTPQQWDQSLNTNLRPYFFTAQSVAPAMAIKKCGSIINLSSNSAFLGLAGYPAYVTAKAAIVGMSKALGRELGGVGIRVNTLVPGWVMTEKQKKLWVTPQALEECLAQQSLPQTIEEDDIVQGALFLASNASKMMTGQALIIDGGRV
ncbi:MAG: NAD(P)-dependent dehydrogenase (short-subunit alcohol dehydrogenase family) [Phenylobacterium sp.]|jgi:NAD(P)-dependent dehydrogenase (short-subunit alcohol dehydrogenase family)